MDPLKPQPCDPQSPWALHVCKDGLPSFLVPDGKIMENEVATARRKIKSAVKTCEVLHLGNGMIIHPRVTRLISGERGLCCEIPRIHSQTLLILKGNFFPAKSQTNCGLRLQLVWNWDFHCLGNVATSHWNFWFRKKSLNNNKKKKWSGNCEHFLYRTLHGGLFQHSYIIWVQ